MQSQNVRRAFLRYFEKKGHILVPSSSVLPHEDPTLLFTNAGMNQFKDTFLGTAKREYTQATSTQKCVRVGGKHNDLENVGHTSRHLTFFEMLGNFSFGDYFKKEAIAFSWEVATEVFGFEPEQLWPTVYEEDDEAFELWKTYVPENRITRMGKEDNYWEMGDTGPCGPCSELHYDRGESYGSAPSPAQDPDGERYLEFWNLVFMQNNRSPDGSLSSLPNPSIDTGAGLERIVMLQMGVDTLFETDILRGLIAQVEQVSGIPYDMAHEHLSSAFRVIADHLRTLSFAIADGVQPGNVDRGYVLRKLLRRAVRYGKNLGFEKPFLAKILPRLIEVMGPDFPELKTSESIISEVLTIEEESFFRTLKRGGSLLKDVMERSSKTGGHISGDDAFKLKDTYGFPIEEILLLAKDAHYDVDMETYAKLEEEAKERSRQTHKVTQQVVADTLWKELSPSTFLGYQEVSSSAKVVALIKEGEKVDSLQPGDQGIILLDKTPFYAEMGGQIGDVGEIIGKDALFTVTDCQAPFTGLIAHSGKMENGSINVGDTVTASIDEYRRQKIANNHTATHLLHWALIHVLGEHIKQAGSVVEPNRLRFDFSHHKALTDKEIHLIEKQINEKIRENRTVNAYEIPYKQVQGDASIKQFFGEKYGEKVRVIDLDYSKELCGGTHTTHVGNIGVFKIAKEGSIASGVRRIEAVTGPEAIELYQEPERQVEKMAALLKVKPHQVEERLQQLIEENKAQKQQLKKAQEGELQKLGEELWENRKELGSIPYISKEIPHGMEALRTLADLLLQKHPELVLFLATSGQTPSPMLIRVGKPTTQKGVKAGDLIRAIAPTVEGTGGGKPESAQGAAKEPKNFPKAFLQIEEELKTHG